MKFEIKGAGRHPLFMAFPLLVHRIMYHGCKSPGVSDLIPSAYATKRGESGHELFARLNVRASDEELVEAARTMPELSSVLVASWSASKNAQLLRKAVERASSMSDYQLGADDLTKAVKRRESGKRPYDANTLADYVIFRVDNIADYFALNGYGENPDEQLFNIAPMFNKFWVEFQIRESLKGRVEKTFQNAGVAFRVIPIDRAERDYPRITGSPHYSEAKWCLEYDVIVESSRNRFVNFGGGVLVLSDQGRIVSFEDVFPFSEDDLADLHKHVIPIARSTVFPALLAVGVMNCKNARIEPVKIEQPARGRNKKANTSSKGVRNQRDRTPAVGGIQESYQVIKIDAIDKTVEVASELIKSGRVLPDRIVRAIGVVRGHFKTFTEDRPLFGQHVGTYWWGPRIQAGALGELLIEVNDYEVKAEGLGLPPKTATDIAAEGAGL